MNTHSHYYRAHTPEQKWEVIERLYMLWVENPDYCLGQLIANIYKDPYNVEDFDLIDTLERRYNEIEKARKQHISREDGLNKQEEA